MTTTRLLTGSRLAEIHFGDTLQVIAARELGDASLWPDLVSINDLSPPYITGDPTQAGPRVKLYGDLIVLPSGGSSAAAASDPSLVYGVDISLGDGELSDDGNGDLALVSGVANLDQAMENRVQTDLGELLFHRTYGCGIRRLLGAVNGPGAALLAAQYVKSALRQDDRISLVTSAVATVTGDVAAVAATVQPVTGAPVQFSSQV